mmetsp:Transcript_40785/g.99338  ORF Transcript_40785/g.99338 Transcript_40785/m.99338 type:complete len:114 (-) Transcript_40785:137-478(-)
MSHPLLKAEMEDQLNKADRLLHRTPKEMAFDVARGTDEAIVQATMGKWDPHRTYGPLRDDTEVTPRLAAALNPDAISRHCISLLVRPCVPLLPLPPRFLPTTIPSQNLVAPEG